ncbi:Transcription factor [Sesamum alatum]|uniref:Transcription factor n=1 Tax=Sesamum alatum TaxID=300844 RepID=A0AAE2CR87_9LAMI|nr:Transcription factor [Sesamum alatum]
MFSLQSDSWCFEDVPLFLEQDKILEDLLADCAALDQTNGKTADQGVKKRPRKASSGAGVLENKDESSNETKKIMHRDVERQRRQEMSGLYASIRSLLPLEYVKGKRAISDHLDQAVNYIKHTQKKIEEMKTRRDKLKNLSSSSGPNVEAEDRGSSTTSSSNCVKLNLCRDGVEILISSCPNEGDFPLSKVLADLLQRGLDAISCISTRVDGQSLHKIQIQVNDPTSIDLSKLQERLAHVIRQAQSARSGRSRSWDS